MFGDSVAIGSLIFFFAHTYCVRLTREGLCFAAENRVVRREYGSPPKPMNESERITAMRVAKNLLVLCLLALPTVALADVYPLNGPPDIYIDQFFTQSSLTMTGDVASIGDVPATGCGGSAQCTFAESLIFSSTSSGFTITGNTPSDRSGTYTYLSGSYVTSSFQAGGEVGIEYSVTSDNQALWTALEKEWAGVKDTQDATNLPDGTLMVMDIHNYGAGDADADMTPAETTATPEPATLTLLGSGILAGLLRKRLARKKA
jgi:hypothetical protein